MTRSAEDVAERPWDAVAGWLRRFVAYIATKRVIAEELRTYPPKTPTSSRAAPPRSPKRASRCSAAPRCGCRSLRCDLRRRCRMVGRSPRCITRTPSRSTGSSRSRSRGFATDQAPERDQAHPERELWRRGRRHRRALRKPFLRHGRLLARPSGGAREGAPAVQHRQPTLAGAAAARTPVAQRPVPSTNSHRSPSLPVSRGRSSEWPG